METSNITYLQRIEDARVRRGWRPAMQQSTQGLTPLTKQNVLMKQKSAELVPPDGINRQLHEFSREEAEA